MHTRRASYWGPSPARSSARTTVRSRIQCQSPLAWLRAIIRNNSFQRSKPGGVPVVHLLLHLAWSQPRNQTVEELVGGFVERYKVPVGDAVESQVLPFGRDSHMVVLGPTKRLKLVPLPDQVLEMDWWMYCLFFCQPALWHNPLVLCHSRRVGPLPRAALAHKRFVYLLQKVKHLQYQREPLSQ